MVDGVSPADGTALDASDVARAYAVGLFHLRSFNQRSVLLSQRRAFGSTYPQEGGN